MNRRGWIVVLTGFAVAFGLLYAAESLWAMRGWVYASLAVWLTCTALLVLFWLGASMLSVLRRAANRYAYNHKTWWLGL